MVKNLPGRKILLYYSTAAAIFLTLSGFFSVKDIKNASFQLILLPVTMFLFLSVTKEIKTNLSKKGKKEPVKLPKSKKKGALIFFVILYAILVSYGLYNTLRPKADIQESADDATPSSSPLIFKNEEEATESGDLKPEE